jgi:hypothetical protein
VQQHGFNFTYQLESGSGADLPSSGQVSCLPKIICKAFNDTLILVVTCISSKYTNLVLPNKVIKQSKVQLGMTTCNLLFIF